MSINQNRLIMSVLTVFTLSFSCSFALQSNELLTRINAKAKPYNGPLYLSSQCQSVAVIDTGFDQSAPLLQNALNLKHAFNARDNNKKIEESILQDEWKLYKKFIHESHGTHVAGIIAQISPHTQIIPVKVGGNKHPFKAFMNAYEKLIKAPVSIVNYSWGVDLEDHNDPITAKEANAIKQLVNSGKLLVISAGNENVAFGTTKYTQSLLKLAKDPEIKGRLIFVGSSYQDDDLDERIVKSSNKAGEASKYFITAPGEDIRSCVPKTVHHTGYKKQSGTSMAAPVITGVLSRLLIENPQLSIDEVREMLFQAADKTYHSNPKLFLNIFRYGQGVANFEKASLACQQLTKKKEIQEETKQNITILELKIKLNSIDVKTRKMKAKSLKDKLSTMRDERAKLKSTINQIQQQYSDIPETAMPQLQYSFIKMDPRLDPEFIDYHKRLKQDYAQLKQKISTLKEKIYEEEEALKKTMDSTAELKIQIKKLKKQLL